MTVLSSEMAVISPESELQLCTDPIGDYCQLLSQLRRVFFSHTLHQQNISVL